MILCRWEPGGHGVSGMLDLCWRQWDALWSGDRRVEGEGDVSAMMPSWFLAGVCGKYTSLRTIWLPHVER